MLRSDKAAYTFYTLDNQLCRAFEREAEEYAFALLAAQGYSPLDFSEAMETLAGGALEGDPEERLHNLFAHPPSRERLEAARQAAGVHAGHPNDGTTEERAPDAH